MAAGFTVQIDDLRVAAAAFARLRADAAGLLAGDRLASTGGMAGRDPVLAAWRARYDAMAAAQWGAAAAAVTTLGAIAGKLADTADTYLVAEHDAVTRLGRPPGPPDRAAGDTEGRVRGGPGAGGSAAPSGPGGPAPGGGSAPPSSRGPAPGEGSAPPSSRGPGEGSAPPSSTGPGAPDVPEALAAYHPGGDPERLRAAAAYWSVLADGMGQIAGTADIAFRRVADTGDGAAFSAMRAFWTARYTPCAADPLFNAVVNGAGTLRAACAELADLIEHTRAAVRGAAAEAVADMAPLDLPAELVGKLAWNIPELELLVGTGALAVAYLNDARDAYRFALDRLVERLRPEDERRLRRVAVPPSADAPVGVGLTDVGQIARLELAGTAWDAVAGPHPTPDAIHLTPQQTAHILRGDGSGGGHAPGAGIAGKTEFPRGWTYEAIIAAALSVARDPDEVERSRIAARWEATGLRAGVRIRAIVADDGFLVTAVPLGGPGVVRNPR